MNRPAIARVCGWVVTALVAVGSAFPVLGAGPADSSDLADDVSVKLAQTITAKFPNATPRVAVFPVGDKDGKGTPSISETTSTLQAEMVVKMRRASQGKMFVLDKAGLSRAFRDHSVDPTGINSSDPQATARTLKEIQVEVAIVGSFDVGKFDEAAKQGGVKATFTVVFSDSTFNQNTSADCEPPVIRRPADREPSKRFNVQVLVDGAPLPLQICKAPDSEFHNVYFLELDPSLRGKEYQITLVNKGAPAVRWRNPNDAQRLYGVALTVDGVGTIAQDTGDGKIGLTGGHPKNLTKWLLTPPGTRVIPGAPLGGDLFAPGLEQVAGGPDGSIVSVPGFQLNGEKAGAFTFATAKESIAELVGVTHEIGLITAYIYPQQMPGDTRIGGADQSNAGTKVGRDVPNPIFKVKVDFHKDPVETWRIFYRFKGDTCPMPRQSLQPVVMN